MEFQEGEKSPSVHPNELAITTPQKNTLESVEYMEYKISFSFLTYWRQLCALGINILLVVSTTFFFQSRQGKQSK